MGGVYTELEIGWAGRAHTVKMSFAVVNRVEQSLSLTTLAAQLSKGDVRLTQLASLYSALLAEAGETVPAADIYEQMMLADDDERKELQAMAASALFACFPSHAPRADDAEKKT